MADLKEDLKNEKNSKRRRAYRIGAYASMALLVFGAPNMEKYLISSDDKEKEPVENVKGHTRIVDYQVDTIPEKVFSAAYFNSGSNSIIENYVVGEDNTYNQSSGTVSHEVKHRDNHLSGLRYKPMSLEQFYKTCCHNEISANIVELLQLREQYINTLDEVERSNLEKLCPKFNFYFEALKKGEITTEHSSTKGFDKEMKFIAQGVQKMWMEKYDYEYDKSHCDAVKNFFSKMDYADIVPNEENYRTYRDFVYKIGGIDFGKYLDDIKCNNNNIRVADEMIANEEHREDVMAKIETFADTLIKNFKVTAHAPMYAPMSLEQMAKLLYDNDRASFIREVVDLRTMWLEAESDAERENLPVENMGQDAKDYYKLLKEGAIVPKSRKLDEKDLEFINNITVYIDDYENEALAFYRMHGNNAVRNDMAYKNERSNIYTFDNVDYSEYIREANIEAYNPMIVLADSWIENNSSNASVREILETKADYETDIVYIEKDMDNRLSIEQKYNLARHRMFMQNVMYRNYLENDVGFAENFEKNAEEFSKELKENERLLYNWDMQDYAIANRLLDEHKAKIYLAERDDKVYQEELQKIYTVNGVNILDYCSKNVEEFLPKIGNDFVIEEIEDFNLVDRVKVKFSNVVGDIKESISPAYLQKENEDEEYYGSPQYDEWSEKRRVSEVQYTEVYDFRSNILKDRRDYLALKEDCMTAKMFGIKFDRMVDERARTNYVEKIDENEQQNTKNNTYVIGFNLLER